MCATSAMAWVVITGGGSGIGRGGGEGGSQPTGCRGLELLSAAKTNSTKSAFAFAWPSIGLATILCDARA